MKILYVEDEQIKANQIVDFLESLQYSDITLAKSYSTALRALHNNTYDLLLLDMSLPLHDSNFYYDDDFETYAGLEILDEIDRIGLSIKVIVITAFDVLGDGSEKRTLDQLDKEISVDFSNNYLGIIYYNNSTMEWNVKLKKMLEHLKKYKE